MGEPKVAEMLTVSLTEGFLKNKATLDVFSLIFI